MTRCEPSCASRRCAVAPARYFYARSFDRDFVVNTARSVTTRRNSGKTRVQVRRACIDRWPATAMQVRAAIRFDSAIGVAVCVDDCARDRVRPVAAAELERQDTTLAEYTIDRTLQ